MHENTQSCTITKDFLTGFSMNPTLLPLGIFCPGQPDRGLKNIPAHQPNDSNKSRSDGSAVSTQIYKSNLLFKGKGDLQLLGVLDLVTNV